MMQTERFTLSKMIEIYNSLAQNLYFSLEQKRSVMARKISPLWIVSMVLLPGCGASVRLYSNIDRSAAFDQYSTYNFIDFREGNKKTITGVELERIRVAIAREIEKRGLTFVADDAIVSVKITVYYRQAANGFYGFQGTYHISALPGS